MFIATLSLLTSIYNGYLNNKFVELIQQNVTRGEYIRTCKDLIDSYFLIKLKAAALAAAAERERAGRPGDIISYEADAANAASHFGALGTYLANFQDDAARERYTFLAWELLSVVKAARQTRPGGGRQVVRESRRHVRAHERRLHQDRAVENLGGAGG